jgi:anti-sigma factor RsiW
VSRTRHVSDEQLSAHLDSALAPARSAVVVDHLSACQECSARLARMQATSRAVGELPLMDPPRDVDLGFIQAPAIAGTEVDAGPRWSSSLLPRLLRTRTPAWATGAVAVAAVVVLAVVLVPGLRGAGGANTASRPQLGAITSSPGSLAEGGPPNPAARGVAPGADAQAGANSASVVVPDAGGMTLTLSTPSRSASRGEVVPLTVRLGGSSADQSLASYSITVSVVAAGGTGPSTVGATSGNNLVLRAGASTAFTIPWSSTQGNTGPGTYTLVATLESPGRSAAVSIPVTLT